MKKVPFYLVEDEIFPLIKDWLMRPYPGIKKGTLDESKHVFNYRLSRARRVIENSFGILVARWRIFRGFIRAAVHNVERYLLAALFLHNYSRQTDNAAYFPLGFVDSEDSSGRIKPGEWREIITSADAFLPLQRPHNSRCRTSAVGKCEALKEYLNGPGSVPRRNNRPLSSYCYRFDEKQCYVIVIYATYAIYGLYEVNTTVKFVTTLFKPNIISDSYPRDVTVHSFVLNQTKKKVENVPNAQKLSNQFDLFRAFLERLKRFLTPESF